jgi:hypothetical protein
VATPSGPVGAIERAAVLDTRGRSVGGFQGSVLVAGVSQFARDCRVAVNLFPESASYNSCLSIRGWGAKMNRVLLGAIFCLGFFWLLVGAAAVLPFTH